MTSQSHLQSWVELFGKFQLKLLSINEFDYVICNICGYKYSMRPEFYTMNFINEILKQHHQVHSTYLCNRNSCNFVFQSQASTSSTPIASDRNLHVANELGWSFNNSGHNNNYCDSNLGPYIFGNYTYIPLPPRSLYNYSIPYRISNSCYNCYVKSCMVIFLPS